jgi:hypothetical protein
VHRKTEYFVKVQRRDHNSSQLVEGCQLLGPVPGGLMDVRVLDGDGYLAGKDGQEFQITIVEGGFRTGLAGIEYPDDTPLDLEGYTQS